MSAESREPVGIELAPIERTILAILIDDPNEDVSSRDLRYQLRHRGFDRTAPSLVFTMMRLEDRGLVASREVTSYQDGVQSMSRYYRALASDHVLPEGWQTSIAEREKSTERKSSWLGAICRRRCPRCRRGDIFRSGTVMNATCPACGLQFEREPGYFVGAMYFSYLLSVVFLAGMFFLLRWFMPAWSSQWVALVAVILFLPFVGMTFRYSRTLWIYYDRWAWPDDKDVTP
jgi:uncharacterized protein (DUF983 family)